MKKLVSYLQEVGTKHGWDLFVHASAVALICWIPAQSIWFAFHFIYPGPVQADYFQEPLQAVTIALLLAPILETQMMRMIFYAFGKFLKNNLMLCAVSALVWGLLHVDTESWGVHAVWAFFVLGICFRRLQQDSTQRAVRVVTLMHCGFNALSYGMYLTINGGKV